MKNSYSRKIFWLDKKSYVIKIFYFWKQTYFWLNENILISYKYILLNACLFWLNENIFLYHIKIIIAIFQQPYPFHVYSGIRNLNSVKHLFT